ncbi:MAG TPA: glycosyltransferase family protein [Candidatus Paceibacterota bacterium]
MKKTKILYGICGIGNGHIYRQLPIIDHFAKGCEIMIFAHGASYNFYTEYFKDNASVRIVWVAVPFYVGAKDGLNFKVTAETFLDREQDVFKTNCLALDRAQKELDKPDLVITDYEPISAQYAYARNVPLITIDQQSKYLCGDFPRELGGFTFEDEIARLRMFFPRVDARIACSFFNVPIKDNPDNVSVYPPILKDSIIQLHRDPISNSFLVYISAAREYGQTAENIVEILALQKNSKFHLFMPESEGFVSEYPPNISIYKHGDPIFLDIVERCSGIISTAGHSLLSEAMYLGIPVYAIPVSPYEQHMNAKVISENSFGVAYPKIDSKQLEYFIENIPKFEKMIKSGKNILLKGVGQKEIISFIEKNYFKDLK